MFLTTAWLLWLSLFLACSTWGQYGSPLNERDICYVHVSGSESSDGQNWVPSYDEGDTDLCDFAANHQCIFTQYPWWVPSDYLPAGRDYPSTGSHLVSVLRTLCRS
ncbi:hypothetical protein F9C07_2101348 [Aspergillus flavus]|uniref:Uncharacterized protein n=1 Tax=Aspergillus flavus (strain ATCC 200026 / FGSC A1120 / IAM 13836 / NRRL 3357 / JCM 12722 / SRRC 167) TaxID=332952 RepID=A0A7U2MPD1_ASPFN|nr:hypothetical protein F9C07_2101348 [Aspergillus flavus]